MSKQDNIYWRYKKKSPPKDENAHLNGEVKIIKPADKLIGKTHKVKKWKPKMTEELAKRFVDENITNKQLRWLRDERP